MKLKKYHFGVFSILLIAIFVVSLSLFENSNDLQKASGESTQSSSTLPNENSENEWNEAGTSNSKPVTADNDALTDESPELEKLVANPLENARKRWFEEKIINKSQDNGFYRTIYYKADDFKYSKIRVDEIYDLNPDTNPEARLLSRATYVADHFLIRLRKDQEGLVDAMLAKFPELKIRKELDTEEHVLLEFDLNQYDIDLFNFWAARLRAYGLNAEKDFISSASQTSPFDPDFAKQWALHNTGQDSGTADADIDAIEAWQTQKGSADVIVAVLDTGVDLDHVDLVTNLWTTTVNGSIIRGYDFVNGGTNPDDDDVDGHGTHVAGIIGAKPNNSRGIAGVNWNVQIMPIKVLDADGNGVTSDIIAGINRAAQSGANIINMSLGGSGSGTNDDSDSYYYALKQARDYNENGVLVVASAGNNNGADNDTTPRYPASYELNNIITVGSSDRNDAMAAHSNIGATSVDLVAPGEAIYSTLPDNRYGEKNGTSMAAPHVAGAAAILLAQDPNQGYEDLRTRILNSVDQKDAFKDKMVTGGRLNLNNALAAYGGAQVQTTNVILKPLGNDDVFWTEGELLQIDVGIKNYGGGAATNIVLNLEITQGATYATITSPPALPITNITNMAPNQEAFISNAFRLTAGNLGNFDFEQEVEVKVTVNYTGGVSTIAYKDTAIYQIASLSGKVFDGIDGTTPIAGATVKLSANLAALGNVNLEQQTAADGSYNFSLFTGLVSVRVEAVDFETSATKVFDLTPADPNQTHNFELGVSRFVVRTPTIELTVPRATTQSVPALIENTGTSPVPLLFSTQVSESNNFYIGQQLFGLKGVGSNTPTLILINQYSLQASEEFSINLPDGHFAVDITYFQGAIWILTTTDSGAAALVEYSGENFSFLRKVDLDIANTSTISIEGLLSIPFPGVDDDSPRTEYLALLVHPIRYSFYDPYVYRVHPDAVDRADLTISVDELDVNFFYIGESDTHIGAYGGERDSLFHAQGNTLFEWEVKGGTNIDRKGSYLRPLDLANDTGIDVPNTEVLSLCYFNGTSSLYVLFGGSVNNLVKVNWDGARVTNIYQAPSGLERMTASQTKTNIPWLSLLSGEGSVNQGETSELPMRIDTSTLENGDERTGYIRVQSLENNAYELVTVKLTVGALGFDPSYVGWYQSFFARDPQASGMNADSDNDGISNALEYVIGTNPAVNDPNPEEVGVPKVIKDPDDGNIYMKFNRRSGLPDGAVEIQGKANLPDDWQNLVKGTDYEIIKKETVNGIDRLIISTPFTNSAFFRLLISL